MLDNGCKTEGRREKNMSRTRETRTVRERVQSMLLMLNHQQPYLMPALSAVFAFLQCIFISFRFGKGCNILPGGSALTYVHEH